MPLERAGIPFLQQGGKDVFGFLLLETSGQGSPEESLADGPADRTDRESAVPACAGDCGRHGQRPAEPGHRPAVQCIVSRRHSSRYGETDGRTAGAGGFHRNLGDAGAECSRMAADTLPDNRDGPLAAAAAAKAGGRRCLSRIQPDRAPRCR